MTIWGITIKPIIFAIVAIPVIVIGAVVFQRLQNRNIVPQQIDQRQIDQRQIEQRQLTPARDLEGTWEGTITYTSLPTQEEECIFKGLLRLVIKTQTETTINGTYSYKHGGTVSGHCALEGSKETSFPLNGTISGARLNNVDLGAAYGKFSGSLTADTLTLNQDAFTQWTGVKNPVNLLRQ